MSLAEEIAAHAWEGHESEFRRILAIESDQELASQIADILENGETRRLSGNRYAYWDAASGIVVVVNPDVPYRGTAVISDYDYFLGLR